MKLIGMTVAFTFGTCLIAVLAFKNGLLEPVSASLKGRHMDLEISKCLLEDKEGNLLIAGDLLSKGHPAGIFLKLRNSTYGLIDSTSISNPKEQSVNTLIQSHDGLYFLGGYVFSGGRRRPVILVLDQSLQTRHKIDFPDIEVGEIRSMACNAAGDVLFTGWADDKMLIGRLAFRGFQLELLAQGRPGSEGNALVLDSKGTAYVTGQQDQKNLRVWKYIPGARSPEVIYEYDKAVGNDLIMDLEGDLVVAGTAYRSNYREEALLLKLPLRGVVVQDAREAKCCGSGLDGARALVQGPSSAYYVAGYTASHSRTAVMENHLMWEVSADLQKDSILCRSGGDSKDFLSDLILRNDGTLLSIGTEDNTGNKPLRTCMLADRLGSTNRYSNGVKVLTLESGSLVDENGDGVADPQERCFQKFTIRNESPGTLSDLKLKLFSNIGVDGMNIPSSLLAGHLAPGQQREIYMPVYTTEALQRDTASISARPFSGFREFNNEMAWVSIEARSKVEIGAVRQDKMVLDDASKAIEISFVLKNTSPEHLEDLQVEMLACGIQHLKKPLNSVKRLAVGTEMPISFLFKSDEHFTSRQLPYQIRVLKENKVISSYVDRLPMEEEVDLGLAAGEDSRIFLLSPESGSNCEWNPVSLRTFSFELKGKVVSRTRIEQTNCRSCKVIIQNKAGTTARLQQSGGIGAKGGLGMQLVEEDSTGDFYSYTFSQEVELPDQESRDQQLEVRMQMDINRQTVSSEPVFLDLHIADLHLVTMGIPYRNLNFTVSDARDIDSVFRKQEGKLFRSVNHYPIIGDKIDPTKVNDIIGRLKKKAISSSDLLILFISSHGFTDAAGNYKFIPSNFDTTDKDQRSYIDFQENILQPIQALNCKTLILIDACFSGAAKSGSAGTIIEKLTRPQKGTSTLVSCKADQLSYECKSLQNGIFTEAILEGLNGAANSREDDFITVGELFTYVMKRVPELIEICQPPGTEQNPTMPRQEYDQDTPIFQLDFHR